MDIATSAPPGPAGGTLRAPLRIAIYPETAKLGLRLEALRAFAKALARTPHQVDWVEDKDYRPADLAIVYGAPGIGEGRRRQIRQKIIDRHKGPVLIVETPLFGRKVPALTAGSSDGTGDGETGTGFAGGLFSRPPAESFSHFRVALNGAFHDTGQFCNTPSDLKRWDKLAAELNITLKDYRRSGRHILLIGQVPGDASLRGLDVVKWLESTIIDLRLLTDRPILVRPHPLSPAAPLRSLKRRLKPDRSLSWDTRPGAPLKASLADAWATVTYSSSAAIESLIAGVPTIALSPASLAWPVSDHGLSYVLEPTLYERRPWLDRLAHSQWSIAEIAQGIVWARFADEIARLVPGKRPLAVAD